MISERLGSGAFEAFTLQVVGLAYSQAGRWNEAVEALERSLLIQRGRRVARHVESQNLVYLADARLGRGDGARALDTVDEALALARRTGARLAETEALISRANVLLGAKGRDAVADVESTLAEAANLIEEIGTKGLAPRLLERRAELARLNSDESEHQRLLREAQRLYSEIGAVGHADRLAARRDALRG